MKVNSALLRRRGVQLANQCSPIETSVNGSGKYQNLYMIFNQNELY